MTFSRLAWALTSVFLVTLSLFVWNWCAAPAEANNKIHVEVSKALAQLVVVVLLGSVVASLFKAAEKSSAERDAWKHLRVSFLDRVGISYRDAKAVRRRLRAAGLTDKFGNAPKVLSKDHATVYYEQMQILQDCQLELEALKIRSKSLPAFLRVGELSEQLKRMEAYLRHVLGEFEEYWPQLDNEESVRFDQLEYLREFTSSVSGRVPNSLEDRGGNYGLEDNFASPHDRVIELLGDSF